MDYRKYEAERRLKSLHSKSGKYASRPLPNIFKALSVLFLLLVVVGASIGFGMVKGITDNASSVDTPNTQSSRFITTIYSSAGNLTDAPVTNGPSREEATYEELSKDLINAFVSIEGPCFWSHNGIDIHSIVRVVKGIVNGDYTGGGNAITQQLIRNNVFSEGMESSRGVRIERRLQGQYLAVWLEKNSDMSEEDTKKPIITSYLNTINLGSNILGVKVVTKRYFNKDASDLTPSGCAVLTPITKDPSKPSPASGRESNAEHKRIVFQCIYEQGYITKAQQEEILADDVYDRIQNVDTATKGTGGHYSYFADEFIEQVIGALMEKLDYTKSQASNLLYSGGLQICTTQDSVLRAIVGKEISNPDNYSVAKYSVEYRLFITHADDTTGHYSEENLRTFRRSVLGDSSFEGLHTPRKAAQDDIDQHKAWLLKNGDEIIGECRNLILQPQASFVLLGRHTDKVKALCGGRGEKVASLALDHAGNVHHQPGFTFKIIIAFAPTLGACGVILGTVYYGTPYTIGTRTFRNQWNSGYGSIDYSNIRGDIICSMNIVAVRCLMKAVAPQLGVEYAGNTGITSLVKDDPGAATALGGITKGVSNLELIMAYTSTANDGIYTKPRFFTRVLDHNGKVLVDNEPETKQVLKNSATFLLTDAMFESMRNNRKFTRPDVSISSTSTRAALAGMTATGKSGTTTSNDDAWLVGYMPYYTVGIWGGCDSNQRLKHEGMNNGGTTFHKGIWRDTINRAYEGLSDPGFAVLDNIETAKIYRRSGKRVVSGIHNHDPRGNTVCTEYSTKGTAPTEVCDKHMEVTVCAESGMCPTPYCPTKTTRVYMMLPEGEEGATDDSVFAIPGYCIIHSDASTIIPPNTGDSDNTGSTVIPIGPGYQSPQESTEGFGPGNRPYWKQIQLILKTSTSRNNRQS